MNMGDKGKTEPRSDTRSRNRWLIAPIVALAVIFGAPAAAQATDGLALTNTENTTAAGGTLAFGTTPQGLLPKTQTIFFWTNTQSGGFLNSSRRHIAVTVGWNNSNYEYDSQSGGSGSKNCGTNSSTTGSSIRLVMNYTGTGFKSCGFVFRLKAGAATGTQNASMTFTYAPSGSGGGGCSGPSSGTANCGGWSGGTQSGTASWTATVAANNPAITVSDSSFAFADTLSGTNRAERVAVITNSGNLSLTGINNSLTGTDASDFTVTGGTCGASAALAVAATCTVITTFNPSTSTVTSTRNATLNVSANYGGSPYSAQTVTLSGSALGQTRVPELFDLAGTTATSSFDYGSIGFEAESFETFTLKNTGNWVMAIPDPVGTFSGSNASDYSISSDTCGATIAAGSSCQVTVRFLPASAGGQGTRSSTLTIDPTDETSGPVTLSLTGFAVAPTFIPVILDSDGVAPKTSHAFPDTIGTTSSTPYVFTLRNDGNATLLGTGSANQSLIGTNADQFTITGTTCGSTLLSGNTCTISVAFTPTTNYPEEGAAKQATLRLDTTNGDPDTVEVALSGTSIQARAFPEIRSTDGSAILATRDLGQAATGETNSYTFTLKNNGNVNLVGAGLTRSILDGTDASQFSVTNDGQCGSIAPNGTCTITVSLTPTSSGAKSARLQVGSSNGHPAGDPVGSTTGNFNTSVNLTATGVAAVKSFAIYDTAGTSVKTSHSFGAVNINTGSPYVFTVKNTGNAVINGLASSVGGSGSARFVRTTTCGATLPRDGSCTVTVTFTPTRTSTVYAGLSATSTDGGARSVGLMGAGAGIAILNAQNENVSGVNHRRWADVIGAGGASSFGGDTMRAGFEVELGAAQEIAEVQISSTLTTNDTAPAAGTFQSVAGLGGGSVDVQRRPGSSQAFISTSVPLSSVVGTSIGSYGFSNGTLLVVLCLGGGTATTNNRQVWFRIVNDDGQVSTATGSILRLTNVNYGCPNGGPYLSSQRILQVDGVNQPSGTMNAVVGKGDPVKLQFNTNNRPAPLTGGDPGFVDAVSWRLRNSNSGAMLRWNGSAYAACAAPCTTEVSGSRYNFASRDTGTQQMDIVAPSIRGRWVVEAAPRGAGDDTNRLFHVGSLLVNGAADPELTFGGTLSPRPDTDTEYTISANPSDPEDTLNGGVGQVIEWDLNGDLTDGPGGDGFEFIGEGDAQGVPVSEALTQSFDTTGKTPGPYKIRARVTDNGAVTASDDSARQKIFEYNTTINSLPEAITENFDLEADDPQGSDVEFRANDINSDPYYVSITPSGGNNGEITDPLVTQLGLNDPSYEWPADYTGNDTFSFLATDDKRGTGSAGTLTVRVRPNTTIDNSGVLNGGEIDNGVPPLLNPEPGTGFLGSTVATAAEFDFSSPQEPVVGYECRLLRDNPIGYTGDWLNAEVVEDWADCDSINDSATAATGGQEYGSLGDGLYRFEVRAVNDVDVVDGTPAFRTWRVDNTAPVSEVRVGPTSNRPTFQPRFSNQVEPSYNLRASDAERTPQTRNTFECRVLFGPLSGEWKDCGNPSQVLGSSPFPLLGADPGFGLVDPFTEGTFLLEFRATDEVGNLGTALPETLIMDLTAPDTALSSGPEGLVNTRELAYVVSSTQANSTFDCKVEGDNAGVVISTSACPGTAADGSRPAFTVPQDDVYTLTTAATDPATNRDTAPLEIEFEVDATRPTTEIGSVNFGQGPTESRRTQSRKATVDFTGDDLQTTVSSGVRLYQCRLDSVSDEAWQTCESPERFGALADGPHRLEVRSLDIAGNPDSTPEVLDWTVDRTPPTTTFTVKPNPVSGDVDPSFAFSTNEAVTGSTCTLDNLSPVACESPVSLAELGVTGGLNDGPHQLTVSSVDLAGNAELTAAVVSWEQDSVSPEVEMLGFPSAFTPLGEVEFGWVVWDGSGRDLSPEAASECSLDGEDWEACGRTFEISEQLNVNGPHSFKVRATDGAGNVSPEMERSWTVLGGPPVAPVITASLPENGSTTRLTAASISFGHPEELSGAIDGLFCQIDSAPQVRCEGNFAPDGLADGEHVFTVVAKDAVGNISLPATLSWTVQSKAPVTSINSGPTGLVRQRSAAIAFSSNRAGTFECRIDGSPWAACETPLQLSGLEDGVHSVRVRAVSSVQPVGLKDPTPPIRQWSVDATAPTAVVDLAPTGSSQETSGTIEFSSDDPDAAFQCKVGTGPYDSCESPLVLSGLSPGEISVLIRAIDEAGNLSEPVGATWTVDSPTCPAGFQGTPPNCTEIGPIEGSAISGTLSEGTLSLAALGSVPLPAEQITLTGVRSSDGRWLVPKDGVNFLPVVQTIPDAIGPGADVDVVISISATNDGVGTLPSGGGPATLALPVEAEVEARLNGNALPLGDECALKPITFDLAGTYDQTGKTVTLSSPSVAFPKVTGCGTFKTIVDDLLELPREDIAIDLSFNLEEVVDLLPAKLAKPGLTAPRSVKSGRAIGLTTRLRNTGESPATGVKACLKSPTALVKGAASRCVSVDIAAGGSRNISFKVMTKAGNAGRRANFELSVTYISGDRRVVVRSGAVTRIG